MKAHKLTPKASCLIRSNTALMNAICDQQATMTHRDVEKMIKAGCICDQVMKLCELHLRVDRSKLIETN